MTEREIQDFEEQVRQTARQFVYPPAPLIRPLKLAARTVQARVIRRFGLGLAIALLLIAVTLWVVPTARAAVLRFLQIGVVRILLPEPTRTIAPTLRVEVVSTPMPNSSPTSTSATSRMPTSAAKSIADSLNLYGKTTLKQARASGIHIKVPTALGDPDAVYLQDVAGQAVILVWFDKSKPGAVRISLQIFTIDLFAQKMQPRVLMKTQVKRTPAAWVEGEHMLQIANGDYNVVQLVSQHALIWTEGSDTYRLETALPMHEAIKIAQTTP